MLNYKCPFCEEEFPHTEMPGKHKCLKFKVDPDGSLSFDKSKANKSSTGSLRFNRGKPSMSSLLPEFLLGMAEVMAQGERKYGKNNWKKGNHTSVPYDSGMRHMLDWFSGQSFDEESKQHHLFHAAVNMMIAWYYEVNFKDMDDRDD